MHPVGLHQDIFADNASSLENRLVFGIDQAIDVAQLGGFRKGEIPVLGRGGIEGKFCFAILDWSSKGRCSIDVWTHPRNQHIPHSSSFYPPNTRLTKAIFEKFLAAARNDPNFVE